MGVIRMSLDDSHFICSDGQKTLVSVVPSITGFRSAATRVPEFRKKRNVKGLFMFVGVVLFVVGAVLIGKQLLARSGVTPDGVGSLIPVLQPKLAKDAKGKTNVLLVGIDTRETGIVQLNTDTIILCSYDDATNQLAMLSFPRDLAVSYPGRTDLTRINSIYAIGENAKRGTGLEKLREVVQTISGKTIQYYAMVDLKGFIDAIDVVGGVDVYLNTDISGLYPMNQGQFDRYQRVYFKRGWSHMNGETALQYTRIRTDVIPVSEGSDFGRARHQQQITQAVLDKVSKTETLLDAKKVLELAGVASKNLKMSKVSTEDVQAAVNIMKDTGKPTSFSYVFDLYSGGSIRRLIKEISWNPYMLGPSAGKTNWSDIKSFVEMYTIEPQLATMTKKVLIYTDGTPEKLAAAKSFQKKHYYAKMVVTAKNSPEISTKGFVYAVGGKQYEVLAQFVASSLDLQFKEELPEEIKTIDLKEYAVVAVF
ncbi:hypothetical protein CO112_03145 [Candidatus Dojkabacteria bacterium CG_4_9_14_3_um_filter_150_Dojkabacteria_WS6_41_13]|uniref:Cell envelope-related transcriptional attenuator domain-containing protein n=1 Tax=Candidatus Dojkabacteria bacterium CG_4_10_14_0_2_um_filter_Dojkabacteria_WS6_41_15 TaxID=2014249 RepID=A0A2M7W241_9BACT|nr:MAG: hypothetical protein COX64_02270 [Candidatus Dojkabacteria bacterium CG_4_10_14_0_2_um_filter_Dojkabacteria_WS6_41_15]PJB22665.1 MAG: hypothetical protein CO112_03145 [Candidatus Dojkabacteria bacterium CG_4_9_14_3_um_filter_150_Dojkabacteria_WS6_41_13]